MSETTPTTAAAATSPPTSPPKTAQIDPLLDKDAFLKLMMVQLKAQDPLNPSDPSQYLGQLAQLTTLEQETNIANSAAQSATAQAASTALALLGHTVTYLDANGSQTTGTVQKVDFGSSGPTLTIDGTSGISPASVSEVSSS